MARIGSSVKSAVMKGMEAIGSAASSLASSTQFRVAEMNLSNQRKEILDGFGQKAYQLWQAGASFPPELEEQLKQVSVITEQLNQMRSERAQMLTAQERVPTIQVDAVERADDTDSAEHVSEETDPELVLRDGEQQSEPDLTPSLVLPEEHAEDAAEEMKRLVEEQMRRVSEAGEAASKAIDASVNPPEQG